MSSYVFDPKVRSNYVLVQMSSGVKTFWNGSDFVEDLKQASQYKDYAEAAKALYELDERFVRGRIVPIPLAALEPSESHQISEGGTEEASLYWKNRNKLPKKS